MCGCLKLNPIRMTKVSPTEWNSVVWVQPMKVWTGAPFENAMLNRVLKPTRETGNGTIETPMVRTLFNP